MKNKILIFVLLLTLIFSLNHNVFANTMNEYQLINHDKYMTFGFEDNQTDTNKILNVSRVSPAVVTFDDIVNIRSITSGGSTDKLMFYYQDINGSTIRISSDNWFYNVKSVTIIPVSGVNVVGIFNMKFFGNTSLNLLNSSYDKETNEYIYEFSSPPIVSDEIIVTNSKGNIITYSKLIVGNKLIIKFNELPSDNYTINSFNVSNVNLDIYEIEQQFFTIEAPLKFLEKLFDNVNNIITYVFNKDIKAIKEDISFTDENEIQQDFIFNVENNKLNIFFNVLKEGIFKIQPKSVKSIDESEELSNLPVHELKIDGLQLVHKNFGNFISADLKNLILTFNRELISADVILKNNKEDIIVNTNTVLIGEKLIIDYDLLEYDTSYTLTLNSIVDVNNNTLDEVLNIDFKTLATFGNEGIDTIISEFLNIFTEAQYKGIKIVVLAIGIGIIFIIGKWLWNKTKFWLKKS